MGRTSWSDTGSAAAVQQMVAAPSPAEAVEMALEQVRAFLRLQDSGHILHDGTVSRAANADQVAEVVEGFLGYLSPAAADPELGSLARQIEEARLRLPRAQERLNAYIRILVAARARLADARLSRLAAEAEELLLDRALHDPRLCLLPDGTLAGEPGARAEQSLLATAGEQLQQLAEAAASTGAALAVERWLARVASGRPGGAMRLLNDLLGFLRDLAALTDGPGHAAAA